MALFGILTAALSKTIRFVFKYWWFFVGLVIILPGLHSSIVQANEQQEPSLVGEYLGNTVVSADQGVYEKVNNSEYFNDNESFSDKDAEEKINTSANVAWFVFRDIWKNLILIYFNFRLFFALFYYPLGIKKSEKNKAYLKFNAFLYAIGTMAILQIIVGGIPFQGIFTLIKQTFLFII